MKLKSPEDKLVVIYALQGIHKVTQYRITSTTQTLPQSVTNQRILTSNVEQ
jgi:hypothetical protein